MNTKTLLVGITGKKGSGKTTFGNQLIATYLNHTFPPTDTYNVDDQGRLRRYNEVADFPSGLYRHSFAAPLKDMCITLFDLDPSKVYGNDDDKNTPTGVPFPEGHAAAGREMTIRDILKYVGTDLFRKWVPNIWTNVWSRTFPYHGLVVVDDVRFPNELDAILAKNEEPGCVAKIVRLKRNVAGPDAHLSETSLDRIPDSAFDLVVPADLHGVQAQTEYTHKTVSRWVTQHTTPTEGAE